MVKKIENDVTISGNGSEINMHLVLSKAKLQVELVWLRLLESKIHKVDENNRSLLKELSSKLFV